MKIKINKYNSTYITDCEKLKLKYAKSLSQLQKMFGGVVKNSFKKKEVA